MKLLEFNDFKVPCMRGMLNRESGRYLIFPLVIYGANGDFREFQAVGSVKHDYKPLQVVFTGPA